MAKSAELDQSVQSSWTERIGLVLGINALIIVGGGMIEAGADGLGSPGYNQTRSWVVLVFGLLAWLALAVMIVLVRRAKRDRA